jgi:hypothetical protein
MFAPHTIKLISLLAPVVLVGCTTFEPAVPAPGATAYISPPIQRAETPPDPETERNRQCAEIRSEIARQRGLQTVAPTMASTPQLGALFQAKAQQNIAVQESRYAELQCDVIRVVPGTPVITPAGAATGQQMTFDECFKKCTELTSRSKEECFDACKR